MTIIKKTASLDNIAEVLRVRAWCQSSWGSISDGSECMGKYFEDMRMETACMWIQVMAEEGDHYPTWLCTTIT